jgi:hypothetical protein
MANYGAAGGADQRAGQRAAAPTVGVNAAYNQGVANQGNPNALSPYANATAQNISSPNWQNQIAGYLQGQAGQGIAGAGLQGALASAQLGMVGPQTQLATAEAQNQGGYSLANALLGYQGTQLQSQGLAQQASTAAGQQGIEESQFGVQQSAVPEQLQQAALANANATRGITDSGAISGTLNTTGQKRAQETQAAQYGWQQADIFRNQQLAQLGQQSEQLGFAGQESGIANQQQQLALAAKGQGLSAQQAQDQLAFGLQQLGISAQGDVLGFMQQGAQAQGAEAQQYAAALSQAGMIGGLGPNFGGA